MTGATATAPVETEKERASSSSDYAWKVVLFNCDCHTFDEVERQLIKATHCSLARARDWAWEVHSKGLAVVYNGPKERCEAVAAILEDIRLVVKITQ